MHAGVVRARHRGIGQSEPLLRQGGLALAQATYRCHDAFERLEGQRAHERRARRGSMEVSPVRRASQRPARVPAASTPPSTRTQRDEGGRRDSRSRSIPPQGEPSVLETLRRDLFGELRKNREAMEDNMVGRVLQTVGAMEERCNQRFAEETAQRRLLAQRVTESDKIQAEHDKRLAALEKELELSRSATHPQPPVGDDFDRQVDGTIIRVHSNELLALTAVEVALKDWISELDVPSDGRPKVRGPLVGLANKFTVQFPGNPRTAAMRAGRALRELRSADGTWRDFSAQSPSAGEVRLYLIADENRRRVRTEQAGRRLLRVLKEQVPGKEFHLIEKEGCVTVGWKKLARVSVDEDSAGTTLEWQARYAGEVGVDMAAIQEAFARSALAAATAAEPWSSS